MSSGLIEAENCAAGCPKRNSLVVITALHEFAESLGAAVDAKDHHTRQHSEEVAMVARALALHMGLAPARADIIHVAAHLHDVGKIGVPDAVLRKPGALSVAEWQMIRRHPIVGAEIVRPVRALRECGVLEMILHHHERFDGRGYPQGLAGKDIPLGARIIAVADSLSAMLQKRTYRPEKSFTLSSLEIVRNAGTQFDPAVVQAFCDIQDSLCQMTQSFRAAETPRKVTPRDVGTRTMAPALARTAREEGGV